jgi:hypothetical protein
LNLARLSRMRLSVIAVWEAKGGKRLEGKL